MNIAIIGVGGVGGYFGGKLTALLNHRDGLKIYFVARGAHLNEIKKNGLLLDSDDGRIICKPTFVTDKITDLPELDLCLLCVKSYDLANVLKQLKANILNTTMILPLLNGVDIYERIRSVISNGVVFPSCVYVATHIEKPGMVVQKGGACTIHFGKDPKKEFVNPELFPLLQDANIKYSWNDNPYTEIWSKFIFISAFGLVTAAFNKTIGELLQSEEISGHVKNIMSEIYAIAVKKGIPLSSKIVPDSYAKAANFPFDTKTSFQRDYEAKDKPDERDLFGGAVIRMGKELGVKTETTSMIYGLIEKNKKI